MQTFDPIEEPNDPAAKVGNSDRLLGICQWPGVAAWYKFTAGSRPSLLVELSFDPCAYLPDPNDPDFPWHANACKDVTFYERIHAQIHQVDQSGVNDVEFAVSTTLLDETEEETVLSAADVATIHAFVELAHKFISDRAATAPRATGAPPIADCDPNAKQPPPITITRPAPAAKLVDEDILELVVRFDMMRRIDLVTEKFKDDPAVALVSTLVKPWPAVPPAAGDRAAARKGTSGTDSYKQFAVDFENAFRVPGEHELKLATEVGREGAVTGSQVSLWVVRLALAEGGKGIHYDFTKPIIYAAKPLATSLQSRPRVKIYLYSTGEGIDWETPTDHACSSIDLDVWAQQSLAAIDCFLSPNWKTLTIIFPDLRSQTPDAQKLAAAREAYRQKLLIADHLAAATNYQDLLDAKKNLACSVRLQMDRLLASQTPDAQHLAAAREAYREQLLNELSSAYKITAAVQYPATVQTNTTSSSDATIPLRLCGQPTLRAGAAAEALDKVSSLTAAKVWLGPKPAGSDPCTDMLVPPSAVAAGGPATSELTFLFTTKNVLDDTKVTLPLCYPISHVEHDIASVGINGYQASAWLTFINPPTAGEASPLNVELGEAEIPVPLRPCPIPSMVAQEGLASPNETAATPKEQLTAATLWDYTYTYAGDQALQDTIHTEIKFNLTPSLGSAKFDEPARDLFQDLAQFVYVLPQLEEDLCCSLSQITVDTPTGDEMVKVAAAAMKTLVELTSNLAEAWQAWGSASADLAAEAPAAESIVATIRQEIYTDASDIDCDPSRACVKVLVEGRSPTGMSLPTVDIPGWTREAIPDQPEGRVAFRYYQEYTESKARTYLTWEAAREIRKRKVSLHKLNSLGYQSAWSSIVIRRNEHLVDAPTNADFIYQTPEVRLVDALIPLLDGFGEISIGGIDSATTKRKLVNRLEQFFSTLFAKAHLSEATVKLEVRYAYPLVDPGGSAAESNLPHVELPILLGVPTTVAIPDDITLPAQGCPTGDPAEGPYVCSLAEAISHRFTTGLPSTDDARLLFDLSIFSSLNESKMPLLRLRNLYLLYSDIDPIS